MIPVLVSQPIFWHDLVLNSYKISIPVMTPNAIKQRFGKHMHVYNKYDDDNAVRTVEESFSGIVIHQKVLKIHNYSILSDARR